MLTRREAYPRYNTPVPDLDIPEGGQHLWNWYSQVSQRVGRIRDGVCSPIPPSEWLAWQTLTAEIVYPWEHGILGAMDIAFCVEMNKELEAKRLEQQDEIEKRGRRKK